MYAAAPPACRTCRMSASRWSQLGLPGHCLPGAGIDSGCFGPTLVGQAVQVARGPSWDTGLPRGLQKTAISQPDQNGVQRSRLQFQLQAQVVTVAPSRRVFGQGPQEVPWSARSTNGCVTCDQLYL